MSRFFPPPDRTFEPAPNSPGEHAEECVIVVRGSEVLDRRDEEGCWCPLPGAERGELGATSAIEYFLGQRTGAGWFAIEVAPDFQGEFVNLRALGADLPHHDFDLIGRALQVIDWGRTHRFCGRCGEAMKVHQKDRAMVCPRCRNTCYPRLSPSIITLVHREDEVLLARNQRFPEGMYSTLAGFVEPGESIEHTLRREVREEVGVEVQNIRYLGSQPWPFPNSLMLGFHAEYAGGDIVLQEEEIADARWFPVRDLPSIPGSVAISRWLIDTYLEQRGVI
ncbi:MAG: NAD(+) diphosphatase [Gammaproteobacteria bacterium]|nr:NAD(+) diphosphatase [Gammaproteobacteria bacterium]